MKYKHELIGNKVLIICDCDDISIHRIYCAYILGEVIDYNPITNEISIRIINNDMNYYRMYKLFYSKLGTRTYFEFKLNTYDPFDHKYCSDNRLGYIDPRDYNDLWWYEAYSGNEAISLLKNNLLETKDKPVYNYCYLSTDCYGSFKSKKEYLTYLLNELSNENTE